MREDGSIEAQRATDSATPAYTVRAVADRLGVPTATLRSWNRRYGIGPQTHEPGRHRNYTEYDIRVVEKMLELISAGASPASAAQAATNGRYQPAPELGDTAPLLAAAFQLDTVELLRLLAIHFEHFGVVATWEHLCRPAFAAIVREQGDTGGCVDVEHVLSWSVVASLHRIPNAARPGSILLACAEDELHTMPLEVLRAALAERDVGARVLGSVPQVALADAIARTGSPATVLLWASSRATIDRAALMATRDAHARVYVAGPGWGGSQPSGTRLLESLAAAVEELVPVSLQLA
ncbi:MerR family transcriptional regulator [Antrihabitans sp. YC2-6]|uniref:MerR family transcriptional regulator n=1 Tax=Antrihabitans sp. YC2-6 TaxID=2799498 RepID=UPI0018F45CBF|nr:MerR family transcriptional regulator [Antrihabitans sp. YC2-6]MBJ8346775.1 MerR family transcriptional regulator [Antrihabitans sp. YC2-6]